jgi:DUF1365 family protein
MTLAIIARIHWHALQLWLKRVRFHRKPEAPASIRDPLTCTTRIPHPPARPLP